MAIYMWEGTPIIPSDYQEVEWIWSSWTQRIDTWVRPNNVNYWFECKTQFTALSWDWNVMNLWWTSVDDNRYWWWGYGARIQVWHPMNWSSAFSYVTGSIDTSTIYTSSYNYNWNKSFILNDVTKTSSLMTGSYTYNTNWNIFCQAYSWAYARFGSFNLYYMKIYSWTTLIRDFVPCYRKSDNVIWLYDTVNSVFYTNNWSWTFTKWGNV